MTAQHATMRPLALPLTAAWHPAAKNTYGVVPRLTYFKELSHNNKGIA
jgi:hypothetical protein